MCTDCPAGLNCKAPALIPLHDLFPAITASTPRPRSQVGKIVSRALKSLQSHGVVISREAWLKEAEAAERAQPACVHTCRCEALLQC
jgi:MinD superfamily P-loop ATPase